MARYHSIDLPSLSQISIVGAIRQICLTIKDTTMDKKDRNIEIKRLAHDVAYYNNVFKKTEKAVSVLFYILSFKKDNERDNQVVQNLSQKSFYVHELSLKTLAIYETSDPALEQFQCSLVALQSAVLLASTARAIPADMATVVSEHLDVIQRYLANHYLNTHSAVALADETLGQPSPFQSGVADGAPAAGAASASRPKVRRLARVHIPAGDISSDAYLVHSKLTDRAERIKTVLEAKPQATIKDIAEIITDVSEKTIQRELNSLIEKGQAQREGERRWSRYSVIKD